MTVVGIIISLSAVWSTKIHSSTAPPVRLWPLLFSVALNTSMDEPFLNRYLTSLVEVLDSPRSRLNSLFRAGINVQIYSIFDMVILAACSFSIVILKAFYPLVLLLSIRNSSA